MLLVFFYVQLCQNLVNEVPKARYILADFAAYHLNSLNGKINGSRREKICMGPP